jgi:hypothetical protein
MEIARAWRDCRVYQEVATSAEIRHPRRIVCMVPTGEDGDVTAATEEAVALLLREAAVTNDDLVVCIAHYDDATGRPRISIAPWLE